MKYGPADAYADTSSSVDSVNGSAWKKGMPSFETSPPSGSVSSMISLSPSTRTPDAVSASPLTTSCAPTMPVTNWVAGDHMRSARLMANAKLPAVTALPSLKRKPGFTVNVYVLPSAEISGKPSAASGTSMLPSGAGRSG